MNVYIVFFPSPQLVCVDWNRLMDTHVGSLEGLKICDIIAPPLVGAGLQLRKRSQMLEQSLFEIEDVIAQIVQLL